MSSYGEPLRNKPILIVCALEMETQGELDNYDVLYTGVGKVNATLKLTQKFGKYGSFVPYSLVINYGTAGSQSDLYQKGDYDTPAIIANLPKPIRKSKKIATTFRIVLDF